MRVIKNSHLNLIAGGIEVGSSLVAITTGFIVGGPVGAGIAVSGIVATKGIENLQTLYTQTYKRL